MKSSTCSSVNSWLLLSSSSFFFSELVPSVVFALLYEYLSIDIAFES
uniref:Uncharacterized protein n=1 Tax=Arundo donax TaxID=35708 RepID=A0A0A8ZIF5_ARUDO